MKNSIDEIRKNFDNQVEQYVNIEKGQSSAIDSPLCMNLIAKTASLICPNAANIMDLGCGGGNYAVKVASLMPNVDCTLVDISSKMLDEATKRTANIITGKVTPIHGDFKTIEMGENAFDIVTAGTTLHHLREESEWKLVFSKVFRSLKPGGLFLINDIVVGENKIIDELMLEGWVDILKEQSPDEAGNAIAAYQEEDSPRSLSFLIDLLKETGFAETVILHKHFNFAAFYGRKL